MAKQTTLTIAMTNKFKEDDFSQKIVKKCANEIYENIISGKTKFLLSTATVKEVIRALNHLRNLAFEANEVLHTSKKVNMERIKTLMFNAYKLGIIDKRLVTRSEFGNLIWDVEQLQKENVQPLTQLGQIQDKEADGHKETIQWSKFAKNYAMLDRAGAIDSLKRYDDSLAHRISERKVFTDAGKNLIRKTCEANQYFYPVDKRYGPIGIWNPAMKIAISLRKSLGFSRPEIEHRPDTAESVQENVVQKNVVQEQKATKYTDVSGSETRNIFEIFPDGSFVVKGNDINSFKKFLEKITE